MNDTPCCPKLASYCETAALVIAGLALAGSLYFSIVLGLQACPLCIYERTFLMGVIAILGLGGLVPALREHGAAPWLALPLAVGGLGVVAFHVRLELVDTIICPTGFLNAGTIPKQALLAFLLLSASLVTALLGGVTRALRGPAVTRVVIGIALGALFSYLAIASGPKMPEPTKTGEELRALQQDATLPGCTPVKH